MSRFGDVLDFDLTTGQQSRHPVDEASVRFVLGGRGYGVRELWSRTTAATLPLSPENPLILATGLLTGSGVPIIPVDVAGRAVLQAFDSPDTGHACLLQAGREQMVYRIRGIHVPLDAEGTPARPADPSGVPTSSGSAEPPPDLAG